MRIGLLPLDERPVNTRYPAMIAQIAGAELVLPPSSLLSYRRQPANCGELMAWLQAEAPRLDALVVSLEMLGYGGLIASRTTDDPAVAIANRLEVLRAIKQAKPELMIYAFDLITRISRSDDNFEEPLYWSDYGSRIYRYSQLLDQKLQGQRVDEELRELRASLPDDIIQDVLKRRLRNHTMNLMTVGLAADDLFDLLVISSDDTSPYGLGTREKRWVTEWVDHLFQPQDRLLMYPGADEVGTALTARALCAHHSIAPVFDVVYAIPADAEITAPFEDGPVRITVERQIKAVGGRIGQGETDFIVAVNTPARQKPATYALYDEVEAAYRRPYLERFTQQIQGWIEAGRHVILADVAYPNGADPVLVDLLFRQVDIHRLAAYGAWNTAGNTIGVALGQGLAASLARNSQQAQEYFLTHRFLEDWGYQYVVRAEVRQAYIDAHGISDIAPDDLPQVKAEIEERLGRRLAELPILGSRWRIRPGSIRLPWDRFFEVDFDLEFIGESGID